MGAPNIDEYLPGPKSIIKVTDFVSPKQLADHLLAVSQSDARGLTELGCLPVLGISTVLQVEREQLVTLVPLHIGTVCVPEQRV